MSNDDVEKGFDNLPDDFTTQCPTCGERFETSGIIDIDGKMERFVWLCHSQTKEQLSLWLNENKDYMPSSKDELVEYLLEDRPELVWNSYRHYNGNKKCGECGQDTEITVVNAVWKMLSQENRKKIRNKKSKKK